MSSEASKNLIKDIEEVFSSISYPKGQDFFKAIADRDYLKYKKKSEVKLWNNISKNDLIKYYDFIFFLKGESILYYLPSYMINIANHHELGDHLCADSLLSILQEIDLSAISEAQINTIRSFLRYCFLYIHPQVEMDEDQLLLAMKSFNVYDDDMT